MKRFSYLLGQTELFQHFVDIKVSTKWDVAGCGRYNLTSWDYQKNRDPAFAEMLEAQQAKDSGKGKKAVYVLRFESVLKGNELITDTFNLQQ